MTALTRWQASTDPAIKSGTATFNAGGVTVVCDLPDFVTAQHIARLVEAAVIQARKAQADYLRGAINHVIQGAA